MIFCFKSSRKKTKKFVFLKTKTKKNRPAPPLFPHPPPSFIIIFGPNNSNDCTMMFSMPSLTRMKDLSAKSIYTHIDHKFHIKTGSLFTPFSYFKKSTYLFVCSFFLKNSVGLRACSGIRFPPCPTEKRRGSLSNIS